jgi:hypothetical protein
VFWTLATAQGIYLSASALFTRLQICVTLAIHLALPKNKQTPLVHGMAKVDKTMPAEKGTKKRNRASVACAACRSRRTKVLLLPLDIQFASNTRHSVLSPLVRQIAASANEIS